MHNNDGKLTGHLAEAMQSEVAQNGQASKQP
jgi:hypothetical protein